MLMLYLCAFSFFFSPGVFLASRTKKKKLIQGNRLRPEWPIYDSTFYGQANSRFGKQDAFLFMSFNPNHKRTHRGHMAFSGSSRAPSRLVRGASVTATRPAGLTAPPAAAAASRTRRAAARERSESAAGTANARPPAGSLVYCRCATRSANAASVKAGKPRSVKSSLRSVQEHTVALCAPPSSASV